MIYRSVHSLNSTLCLQLKEIRDYKRNDLTPGQAPRAEESEEEESEVEEEEEEEEEQDVSQEEEEVCAVNCCSHLFIHAIKQSKADLGRPCQRRCVPFEQQKEVRTASSMYPHGTCAVKASLFHRWPSRRHLLLPEQS